jgi:hypothetical protein
MPRRWPSVLYVALVIGTAAVMGASALGSDGGSSLAGASAGVRPVDRDRVLRLIQEGRLTDHDAAWWQPLAP